MDNLFKSKGIDLNLLQNSYMDETGWHLDPSFSQEDVLTIYKIYRKLILDGEMPVAKIAGFQITSGNGLMRQSAGSIFKCHESLFEIINHLQEVILFPVDGNIDTMTDIQFGDVTTQTLLSNTIPKNMLQPLNDTYLFHMSTSTKLKLRIHTGKGIVSAEDNHKAFTDKSLIPIMTDHSLVNYVNIMHIDGHTIRHKIRNGLSFENFKRLFNNYLYESSKSNTREVCYNVDEIFSQLYTECSKYKAKAVEKMRKLFIAKLTQMPLYNSLRQRQDFDTLSKLQYNIFKDMFISTDKKDTIDLLIYEYGFTEAASRAIATVLHEYV